MNAVMLARQRHPSARPVVSARALRERVADELELSGARHAEVAAAILSVRGVSGLDQVAFARRAGVAVDELVAAERGEVARSGLPSGLRPMVPR